MSVSEYHRRSVPIAADALSGLRVSTAAKMSDGSLMFGAAREPNPLLRAWIINTGQGDLSLSMSLRVGPTQMDFSFNSVEEPSSCLFSKPMFPLVLDEDTGQAALVLLRTTETAACTSGWRHAPEHTATTSQRQARCDDQRPQVQPLSRHVALIGATAQVKHLYKLFFGQVLLGVVCGCPGVLSARDIRRLTGSERTSFDGVFDPRRPDYEVPTSQMLRASQLRRQAVRHASRPLEETTQANKVRKLT